MLSDSETRKLNEVAAERRTGIDTNMRHEVETLSFTEVLNLFFEAIEERDILRTENRRQRDELIDLEAQVSLLIEKNADLELYFSKSQKWLDNASSVGEAYHELKDGEERSEDGVIALLTGLIEWAYNGYGAPGRANVERLRSKANVPF